MLPEYLKKTGSKYHPFDYRYNFAIKYLISAGYITTEDNRNLELSKKGRQIDIDNFDPVRNVRATLKNLGVMSYWWL